MSIVAEFAAHIHKTATNNRVRSFTPVKYYSQYEKIKDVKAVIFDVYGTLVNYWRSEFSDKNSKERFLMGVLKKTSDYFEMTQFLDKMNPAESGEKTLYDLYHGLISLDHEKSLRKNVNFPEIRIERIWEIILMMLKRHGYTIEGLDLGGMDDVSRCLAFYYNYHALGRGYYPGVVDTLKSLKSQNIKLGIVSNAQFYTPIDLTLFLRDQSENEFDDYQELFDHDLTFYSYEYGAAKPNSILFQKLYDALYELHILPSQTVYVGNDLASDIKPAREAGMHTAFFSGDEKSAFMYDLGGKEIPDITFTTWNELSSCLSFYEGN